jgi:hypothetical protein
VRQAVRVRLDRLARRLGPGDALTKAEARELAALEAERDALPPFERMTDPELDAWFHTWAWGAKGARLDELRQRARTLAERRADEDRAARFAAMGDDELDRWLAESMREGANLPSV